ncbi:MAG: DUF58 domain-containing protein [Longimicrobiales bacterium]|nr:DUF58 domain-containing protein [Longimicrobiales bacterium]
MSKGPLKVLRRGWSFLVDLRARLRAWRRISFTSGGLAFTLGTMAVGFAAMNTGNNLLYLLLGSMLGFIAVSGWLSEQAIRALKIERRGPRSVTVGHDLRLVYEVTNLKERLPSMAVEISEQGLPEKAFLAHVPAGGRATARSVNSFVRRGIYPLSTVTLSTGFPFGLFRKERDLEIPGEIVVWPRTDRPVREPEPGGGRIPRVGMSSRGASGARGEYRSLRAYRVGDDSRDIHWKSSARLREPVLRQYERDGSETRWICLDTRGEPGDAAEVAVEVAASLAARAVAQHRPFGLVAGGELLEPGDGAGHLERALDMLARVDFAADDPLPNPPVSPEACVLVSIEGRAGYGDVMAVGRDAKYVEAVA